MVDFVTDAAEPGSSLVTPQTLDDWLAVLETRHHKTIDLGLERPRQVLDRLGLTWSAATVVVAGTNGKGSTCALMEAMLLAAGYRVAVYSSPHLLHFTERLRIQGQAVDEAALLPHFAAVEAARLQGEPVSLTYFEFTTLAMARLCANTPLDAIILEVGLGGRLDAVNLFEPDVAVITSVDLDHQAYLGDTREQIGWEKAHIFRAGRPAVYADPVPVASVIAHAEALGADLWLLGRDFNFQGDQQQWGWRGRGQARNALAYPALRGANQLLNASAALAALAALRHVLPVSQQAVREGLALVNLPGRFQVLAGRPTCVLDVAHNPHAASVLAANLGQMGYHPYTYAVVGILGDKDIDEVLRRLMPRIDHWIFTDLVGPRAVSAEYLADRLLAVGWQPGPDRSVHTCASPAQAWQHAREQAGEDDRIVVCGSFLTVAGVMQAQASERQGVLRASRLN